MPRRILMSGSNFLMAIGCVMTGLANRFEAVVTGNAVSGVGMAATHPVSSSIHGSKFEKKGVGSALSMFYGLGFIGNIISPILLSGIAVMAGWRYAYYLLAMFFVIAGIIAIFGLRSEPAADKILTTQSGKKLWDDIKSALKVKGAIPILVAQAFISGGTGMGVMTTWVPMYMRDAIKGLGLDVGFAGLISSIATIGGVLGTIYLGKVADRHGYLKIATYSLTTTTVCIFLLTFYSDFSLLLIPHLFLLSMTTFSLGSMLQAHLAKSAPPSERDILLGLFFTFGFGVSSLWSTLLGAVIDTYSFTFVWYTMFGAGIAAIICIYIGSRGELYNPTAN